MDFLSSVLVALFLAVSIAICLETSTSPSHAALFDVALGDFVTYDHLRLVFHSTFNQLMSICHLQLELLGDWAFLIFTLGYILPRMSSILAFVFGHMSRVIFTTVHEPCEGTSCVSIGMSSLQSRLASVDASLRQLYDLVKATLTHSAPATGGYNHSENFTSNRCMKLLRRQLKVAKRSVEAHHIRAAQDAITISNLTAEVNDLTNVVPLILLFWGKVPRKALSNIRRYMQADQLQTQLEAQRASSIQRQTQLEVQLKNALSQSEEYQKSLDAMTEESANMCRQGEELRAKLATSQSAVGDAENAAQALRTELHDLEKLGMTGEGRCH